MRPSALSTSGTVRGPHCRASKTDLPDSTDSASPTSNLPAPKLQHIYFLNDVLQVEKSKIQSGTWLRFRQRFLTEIGIGPTRRGGENDYIFTTLDVRGLIQYKTGLLSLARA